MKKKALFIFAIVMVAVLCASAWFYGYYNVSYRWILLASLGLNYGISLLLGGCQGIRGRRILLGADAWSGSGF